MSAPVRSSPHRGLFFALSRESVSVNTQDTEHRAVGLFFGEQTGVVFVVVLVPVDDDVFRDGGVMRTVAGNSYIMIT